MLLKDFLLGKDLPIKITYPFIAHSIDDYFEIRYVHEEQAYGHFKDGVSHSLPLDFRSDWTISDKQKNNEKFLVYRHKLTGDLRVVLEGETFLGHEGRYERCEWLDEPKNGVLKHKDSSDYQSFMITPEPIDWGHSGPCNPDCTCSIKQKIKRQNEKI
jgi:hypothetical protein